MQTSSIPTKIGVIWGAQCVPANIHQVPVTSQIGITNGAASFTDGFPPLTFLPGSSGGVPPFGSDFNGLLNQITAWNQWQATGAPVPYDGTFQTAIGGYPKGAIVASGTFDGLFFRSLVDNNASNPDAGGANWAAFYPVGFNTGDAKLTMRTVADDGWILINGDPFTLGSATSGSNYANSDALTLYGVLWNNVSNSFAPVTGGRGTNAAADFAANKPIAFPKQLGRAVAVAGAGQGLTSRALGSVLGEETHAMLLSELVAHTHGVSDPTHAHTVPLSGGNQTQAGSDTQKANAFGTLGTSSNATGISIQSAGSSTPFNVMQPTTFWNLMVHK